MKTKRGKAVAGLVAGLTSEDATAFSEILNRIKQAANVGSDNAIARVLGLRQSSISTAKTRGSIPPSWIINASNLFNVSADWLIYGDEKHPEKAPEKTGVVVANQVESISQVTEIKENISDSENHLKELLGAYKTIVALQQENAALKSENTTLADRARILQDELEKSVSRKKAAEIFNNFEKFKTQAKKDAAELRSEEDDLDDMLVLGDYRHIKADVTNKT